MNIFAVLKGGMFGKNINAGMVELVDTLDLGSSAARRGGSTPFTRTPKQTKWYKILLMPFLILGKTTIRQHERYRTKS